MGTGVVPKPGPRNGPVLVLDLGRRGIVLLAVNPVSCIAEAIVSVTHTVFAAAGMPEDGGN